MAPDGVLAIVLVAAASFAFAVVYVAIPMLMPLFQRYALSRPNARSSHVEPTPQGGGAPVIAATVLVTFAVGATGIYAAVPDDARQYQTLTLCGAIALAMLGAADDMQPMPTMSRLAMQVLVAGIIVFGAPDGWRLLPALPMLAERALIVFGVVWMVNLTNFMDGIDGIVVAEVVPISLALVVIAACGLLDAKAGIMAAALGGGVLAFGTFNRHPARLFLGDVGSLPIGFLLAALLYQLAATGSIAAALILPAYFVADATSTLLAGWRAGLDVTRPHRRHAYQVAVDRGWRQPEVTRVVLALNLVLVVLAGMALLATDPPAMLVLTGLGYGAAFLVIALFRKKRTAPA